MVPSLIAGAMMNLVRARRSRSSNEPGLVDAALFQRGLRARPEQVAGILMTRGTTDKF